jgi:hypothetical protein
MADSQSSNVAAQAGTSTCPNDGVETCTSSARLRLTHFLVADKPIAEAPTAQDTPSDNSATTQAVDDGAEQPEGMCPRLTKRHVHWIHWMPLLIQLLFRCPFRCDYCPPE